MWSAFGVFSRPTLRAMHEEMGRFLAQDEEQNVQQNAASQTHVPHQINDSAARVHSEGHIQGGHTHQETYPLGERPMPGAFTTTPPPEIDSGSAMDRSSLRQDSLTGESQTASEADGQAAPLGFFATGAKGSAREQSSTPAARDSTVLSSNSHTLPQSSGSSSLDPSIINISHSQVPGAPGTPPGNASYTPMSDHEKLVKQRRLDDRIFWRQAEMRAPQVPPISKPLSVARISASSGVGRTTAFLLDSDPRPGQMGSGNEDDGEVLQGTKSSSKPHAVSIISVGSSDNEESSASAQPVPQNRPSGPPSNSSIPQKRPLLNSAGGDSGHNNDEEERVETLAPPPTKPSNKRPKLGPQSLYVAEVDETGQTSTSDCAEADMVRLRSLFAVIDSNGNEREMMNAASQAARLTRKWNLTKADVITHFEGREDLSGYNIVNIKRRDGNKELPVRLDEWTGDLAAAMDLFFQTGYCTGGHYTCAKGRYMKEYVTVTFAGLADNTAASAHAFARIYNDVSRWALEYKGIPARSSYCRGVCRTLNDLGERELAREMRTAKKAEKRNLARRILQENKERQAQIDRLKTDCYKNAEAEDTVDLRNSDNEGREDDDDGELDTREQDELDRGIWESKMPDLPHNSSGQPAPNTSSKPEGKSEAGWKDAMSLVQFRKNNAECIKHVQKTKLMIKALGVWRSQAKTHDQAAFDQGKKDGKKIDVKGRAIDE
ncbi:unnamed protein product [Zymoseptoria tritici ST99CH_3D7]|uniref:DUF7168 domain-containing protein n=1 Tax=Zymoseptoria tritici (strain ST99CH_3D7) TaxID=1276538 RepID=A0A1X7S2B0_ZYMT9|nr:unnamed protein product [Zymoseptoria tritici ST99CH_3D7]